MGYGIGPLLAIALLVGIGVPSFVWMMVKDPELTPLERTVESLELLRSGRVRTAYLQAIQMLDKNVDDPEIGGALEYIIGVAHFHKAEQVRQQRAQGYEGISEPIYELAVRYLETANQKSLMEELIPNWRYSLGACYFRLQRVYDARHILEDAYDVARGAPA